MDGDAVHLFFVKDQGREHSYHRIHCRLRLVNELIRSHHASMMLSSALYEIFPIQ
jgi:hypothetical protein